MLFLIPIKPRSNARNWPLIEELLNGTLRSLAAQTDQKFEVIVCAHERPAFDPFPDMKLRFIEASWKPRDANAHRDRDRF